MHVLFQHLLNIFYNQNYQNVTLELYIPANWFLFVRFGYCVVLFFGKFLLSVLYRIQDCFCKIRHIVAVDIVLADSIHIQLQKQNLQLIVISVGGKLTMQASTQLKQH